MPRKTHVACLVALVVLTLPATTVAQNADDGGSFGRLSGLIPNLFDRTVVLFPSAHQAHFTDSSHTLRDAGIQINSSIVSQLSTFPLGSPSGGFTYRYDEGLGVFERSTKSFGPIYAERAETIGRGKWNFGFNVFANQYDSIDSLDLRNGDMAFSLTHLDTNSDGSTVESFFEGDLIEAQAFLDLSTQTAVVFGNYGITSNFDLAVAVPYVTVDLNAQLDTIVNRQSSEGFSDPPFHRFSDGTDRQSFFESGRASGVGDILMRAKYNFARSDTAGMAIALDLRLPTGDEEDLLGTGNTQAKLFFIGSAGFGGFAPHVNFGYTFSSGKSSVVGELPNEINFTLGFDTALHPRVTLATDIVWRTLLDAEQVERTDATFLFKPWNSDRVMTTTRAIVSTETEDLNLVLATIGFKINLGGTTLLTLNFASSLSEDGLQDEGIIPLFGIDHSF